MDRSTDWQVAFGDGKRVKMDSLRSWTDGESTRHYSGLAAYEKTFSLPDNFLREGIRVRLDLGEGTPLTAPLAGARTNGMRALLEAPVLEGAVAGVKGHRSGPVWG